MINQQQKLPNYCCFKLNCDSSSSQKIQYTYYNQQNQQIHQNQQYDQQSFNKTKLQQLHQYFQYFSPVQAIVDQQIKQKRINLENLLKHKIIELTKKNNQINLCNYNHPDIYILSSMYHNKIFKYDVIIGNFKLSIDVFNVMYNAPVINVIKINQGSFGVIYQFKYSHERGPIVAKRNYFKYIKTDIFANKQQIREIISEYAIFKIASLYKIGPEVVSQFGFDLVCFHDSIEFYMERCGSIFTKFNHLEYQMKINVRILHKLSIIHKDIKPQNLLYSNAYQKAVLVDFGISHSIAQRVGQMSKTFRQGSLKYMSKPMKNIQENKMGYVDLYYNDFYGLQQSLKYLKKRFIIMKESKLQLQNPELNCQYMMIYMNFLLINRGDQQIQSFIRQHLSQFQDCRYFQEFIELKKFIMILCKVTSNSELINLLKMQLKDQVSQSQKYNYLIRHYGYTYRLLDIIEDFPKSRQKENLIRRICESEQIDENIELGKLIRIGGVNNYIKQIKLWLWLEQSLRPEQQNVTKILSLLFKLFYIKTEVRNSKFNLSSLKQIILNYEQIFERINKYYQKFTIQPDFNFNMCKIIMKIVRCEEEVETIRSQVFSLIENHKLQKQKILTEVIEFYNLVCNQNQSIFYCLILQSECSELIKKCEISANIGLAYLKMYNFQTAKVYFLKITQILKQYEPDRQDLLNCFISIAYYYLVIFQYFQALNFFKKYLQSALKLYGQNSQYVIRIYYFISYCSLRINQYDKALKYCRLAINKYQIYYGQYHDYIIVCYAIISQIYFCQEKFDQSLHILDRAESISLKHLGNHHQLTKKIYGIKTKVYNKVNNKQMEYKYIQKIYNEYIENVPQNIDYYYKMERYHQSKSRYTQAFKYLQKGQSIIKLIYPQGHYKISLFQVELAIYYENIKIYEKAIQSYEKAMKSLSEELLVKRIEIAENISKCYRYLGDSVKQVQYLKYCLNLMHNNENINNKGFKYRCNYYMALVFIKQKKFHQAITHLFESLSVSNINQSQEVYRQLGRCYSQLKLYKIALTYFNKQLDCNIIQKDEQSNCFYRLANIYLKTDQYRLAIYYFTKIFYSYISEILVHKNSTSLFHNLYKSHFAIRSKLVQKYLRLYLFNKKIKYISYCEWYRSNKMLVKTNICIMIYCYCKYYYKKSPFDKQLEQERQRLQACSQIMTNQTPINQSVLMHLAFLKRYQKYCGYQKVFTRLSKIGLRQKIKKMIIQLN